MATRGFPSRESLLSLFRLPLRPLRPSLLGFPSKECLDDKKSRFPFNRKKILYSYSIFKLYVVTVEPLLSNQLSSATSFPRYQNFLSQITLFGISCKRPTDIICFILEINCYWMTNFKSFESIFQSRRQHSKRNFAFLRHNHGLVAVLWNESC